MAEPLFLDNSLRILCPPQHHWLRRYVDIVLLGRSIDCAKKVIVRALPHQPLWSMVVNYSACPGRLSTSLRAITYECSTVLVITAIYPNSPVLGSLQPWDCAWRQYWCRT